MKFRMGQGHQCASVNPRGNREITSEAGERDTSLNVHSNNNDAATSTCIGSHIIRSCITTGMISPGNVP